MSTTVKLISNDDWTIEVDRTLITNCSDMIRDMLSDTDTDEIRLLEVNKQVLREIVKYVTQYPENTNDATDLNNEWNKEFYEAIKAVPSEIPYKFLCDVFMAANYMTITSLLNLCAKVLAKMIEGKSPEDIRNTFGLKKVYTDEEEEAIRKENAWAFDGTTE